MYLYRLISLTQIVYIFLPLLKITTLSSYCPKLFFFTLNHSSVRLKTYFFPNKDVFISKLCCHCISIIGWQSMKASLLFFPLQFCRESLFFLVRAGQWMAAVARVNLNGFLALDKDQKDNCRSSPC